MTSPNRGRNAGIGAALVALVGSVTAAGLYETTPEDESGRVQKTEVSRQADGTERVVIISARGPMHLRAYRDIAGIWTICDGDTQNVRPGMVETPEGCAARLERQLIAHARPVLACVPGLRAPGRDYQRWAAINLAYNIGVGGFCRSSAARHFNAGRWQAGCDAFLPWDKARVRGVLRPVTGLTKRRNRERQVCLTNIVPGYGPVNLYARLAPYR